MSASGSPPKRGNKTDGAVNDEVATLKQELMVKGETVYREQFPSKIGQLSKLLESELLNQKPETVIPTVESLTPALPPFADDGGAMVHTAVDGVKAPNAVGGAVKAAAAGHGNAAAGAGAVVAMPATGRPGKRKKRKLEDSSGLTLSSDDESSDSDNDAHDHRNANLPPFIVPSNQAIMKVMDHLRKEWKETIELVGAVKLWLQLIVPPIESGGQFHTGVLEEVINELTRFEDQAYSSMESPQKYFHARAKLVAKFSRHRGVLDFRQSLLEADQLEYVNLKMHVLELRNSYVVAYDLIRKNEDKLKASTSGYTHMMT